MLAAFLTLVGTLTVGRSRVSWSKRRQWSLDARWVAKSLLVRRVRRHTPHQYTRDPRLTWNSCTLLARWFWYWAASLYQTRQSTHLNTGPAVGGSRPLRHEVDLGGVGDGQRRASAFGGRARRRRLRRAMPPETGSGGLHGLLRFLDRFAGRTSSSMRRWISPKVLPGWSGQSSQVTRPGDGRVCSGRSDRGGACGEVLLTEFFSTDDTAKERESVTRSQSEATPGPKVDSSASKRAKSAVRLQQLTLSSGTIEVRSARSQISSKLHLRK